MMFILWVTDIMIPYSKLSHRVFHNNVKTNISSKIILELGFIIEIYYQKISKLNLALLIKLMIEQLYAELKILINMMYNKRNGKKRYVTIKAFTQWEYNVQNILFSKLVLTIFTANLWWIASKKCKKKFIHQDL